MGKRKEILLCEKYAFLSFPVYRSKSGIFGSSFQESTHPLHQKTEKMWLNNEIGSRWTSTVIHFPGCKLCTYLKEEKNASNGATLIFFLFHHRCPSCGLTSTQACSSPSGWRNAVSLQLLEQHCKRSCSTTVSAARDLHLYSARKVLPCSPVDSLQQCQPTRQQGLVNLLRVSLVVSHLNSTFFTY